uniref:Uncharacterized protein n=1 Tax=Zea mays TaxID=4577 RepID=C4J4L0_MAIZE|nr:unknown [Zea mays]
MGKGRSVYRHYSTGAPHAKRGGDGERGHRVLVLDPVPLLFQRVDELGQLLVGSLRRRRLPRGHGHHVPRQPLVQGRRGPGLALRGEAEAGQRRQRGQPQPDGACCNLAAALGDGGARRARGSRGGRCHGVVSCTTRAQ